MPKTYLSLFTLLLLALSTPLDAAPAPKGKPPAPPAAPAPSLLAGFRAGPDAPMHDVKKIVFAVRGTTAEHWYANFGYYADDDKRRPAPMRGGKLCAYDLDTRQTTVLLDDPTGSVRDPQVHYNGEKILFSYCPGGTLFYHLYEIGVDPKKIPLKQLTFGEFDDIEPSYTAAGKIVFVSSRAKRWVNCWLTQVATIYGCDLDGKNIHALSGNIEHDNTPWPLPDGRILYTRWEYVDRSQVHYHHLWTMNPDGTHQMTFYGNLHPGIVYIDAKPIPNSEKIVASFSWGHGDTEHGGSIGIIDPRHGPDDESMKRVVSNGRHYRDPWAFSENAFLAATGSRLILMNGEGREETLLDLPKEWKAKRLTPHEPRPVIVKKPERVISDTTDPTKTTGRLLLSNVYEGRNMVGVKHGEIKKLLILETLPMPIHYDGGMYDLSWGGTFTLERIIGTVPVEADGSANFELPANRSFFFVALDENDLSVKRMQSFVSVMPGETNSCIGCHEERTATPPRYTGFPIAFKRAPSPITQIATPVDILIAEGKITPPDKTTAASPPGSASCGHAGNAADTPPTSSATSTAASIPDVLDFPRDVQPIFDVHCIRCHSAEKREGRLSLVGHRTPFYSVSYASLITHNLVADGRNMPVSNYAPRTIGSSASRLLKFTDSTHYGTKLTPREQAILRLWIETGATYPGTYAANGSGTIAGYAHNIQDAQDKAWPETKVLRETIEKNCYTCHTKKNNNRIPATLSDDGDMVWYKILREDPLRKFSRQMVFDLTIPEQSSLLLAPLAKSAGGYESCGAAIFKDKSDPRYKAILAAIERAKNHLNTIKRFDMPGFIPRSQYIRELKKYGIVAKDHAPETPVDTYTLDQQYWRSLWYKAQE